MRLMKLEQNQILTVVVLVVASSFVLQITNLPPVAFLLFCCLCSYQFKRQLPVIEGNNVLTQMLGMLPLLLLYKTSCLRQ